MYIYKSIVISKPLDMKSILISIFSLFSFPIFAQDTTFVDKDSRQVNTFKECEYYEVITGDKTDSNNAVDRSYYKSGRLRSEQNIFYKNKIGQFMGGRINEWYDNGQLRRTYFYKGTINLDGEVLTYYKDGKLKRKDIYSEGKLINGHCYSVDQIEVPHSDFIREAAFPGGNNELISFLLKHLEYPKKAKKDEIEGTVYVKFMIDTDGNIIDATVVKHVDERLDKEALRIVNKMPKWSPYIIDGELLASYFMLPVTFALTGD